MTYHTILLQREQSPFHHIQHTNTHEPSFLFLKKFFYYYYYFYYFTVLYWFCHTSTCIRHGCTHVPLPEPSFLITQATFSPTCPPSLGVSQETFCLSADFFFSSFLASWEWTWGETVALSDRQLFFPHVSPRALAELPDLLSLLTFALKSMVSSLTILLLLYL